jgi:hypothetical protein
VISGFLSRIFFFSFTYTTGYTAGVW